MDQKMINYGLSGAWFEIRILFMTDLFDQVIQFQQKMSEVLWIHRHDLPEGIYQRIITDQKKKKT